jgi:hypothetical protein
MTRRFCLLLVGAALAWTEGQDPQDQNQRLTAARPEEAKAQAVDACYDPYWCPPGQGPPGEERPPKPVAGDPPGAPKAPKGAKNILLIIVDDLRPQLNATYGHGFMITPNMDKLASSPGSVAFTRAYAQAAHCAPSRNSFVCRMVPRTSDQQLSA